MQRVLTFLEMFRRERRPGDLVFALGFFLFALALALVLPHQARWVERATLFGQPAFWPRVGVAMMVGFGAVHLVGTLVSRRLSGRLAEVLFWLRALEYAGWFIAYVLLVPRLGYLPSSILFALLLSLRLGYRSAATLGLAVLFAVAVVVIFKTGLSVNIPAGALYDHLPRNIRSFVMSHF